MEGYVEKIIRHVNREDEIDEIKKQYFDSKIVVPADQIVELADVVWQEDRESKGDVIGYLLVNTPKSRQEREFIFAYSKAGLEATRRKGFNGLTAFPNTENVYTSKRDLFSTFLEKLPQKARKDLRGDTENETELLIKYSGVTTDDFKLVPPKFYGAIAIIPNIGKIDTANRGKSGITVDDVEYPG